MASEWFIKRDGKRIGPYEIKAIKDLAQNGQLSKDDLLQKNGSDRWIRAKNMKELVTVLSETFAVQETSGMPQQREAGRLSQPLGVDSHTIDARADERYGVLRLIARISKLIAVMAGVLCTLTAIACFVSPYFVPDASKLKVIMAGWGLIVAGVLLFIVNWAYAEGILVFLDLEENTRKTNAILRKLHRELAERRLS